jgi:hypothetical protein
LEAALGGPRVIGRLVVRPFPIEVGADRRAAAAVLDPDADPTIRSAA